MKNEMAYYRAAQAADNSFQAALEAEFGPGANRFEIDRSKWTRAIKAALSAKIAADEAWLATNPRTTVYSKWS